MSKFLDWASKFFWFLFGVVVIVTHVLAGISMMMEEPRILLALIISFVLILAFFGERK